MCDAFIASLTIQALDSVSSRPLIPRVFRDNNCINEDEGWWERSKKYGFDLLEGYESWYIPFGYDVYKPQVMSLSADVAKGSKTITVYDASPFRVNVGINIESMQNSSIKDKNLLVHIQGNTLTLAFPLVNSYTKDASVAISQYTNMKRLQTQGGKALTTPQAAWVEPAIDNATGRPIRNHDQLLVAICSNTLVGEPTFPDGRTMTKVFGYQSKTCDTIMQHHCEVALANVTSLEDLLDPRCECFRQQAQLQATYPKHVLSPCCFIPEGETTSCMTNPKAYKTAEVMNNCCSIPLKLNNDFKITRPPLSANERLHPRESTGHGFATEREEEPLRTGEYVRSIPQLYFLLSIVLVGLSLVFFGVLLRYRPLTESEYMSPNNVGLNR